MDICNIESIESNGIDIDLSRIDFFLKIFKRHGIFIIRNAFYTKKEQLMFLTKMGNSTNWVPNDNNIKEFSYTENHSDHFDSSTLTENDLILDWHQEHLYDKSPIVAGAWNMYKYNVPKIAAANTLFIDMSNVYRGLPDEWKLLLEKIISSNEENSIDLIQDHWLTKEKVLRYDFLNNSVISYKDGKKLSDSDIIEYDKIRSHIETMLLDKNIFFVQRWQEGDLLVVDLFKMAHNVTGGFDPKDREFFGLWARINYV